MSGTSVESRADDEPDRARVDGSAERLSALEAQVRSIAARLETDDASRPLPAGAPKLAERRGDRVDVLAARVDTLSETVRSAAGTVVARERELADVRRELGELRGRVDRAVADLQLVDRAPVEALRRTAATVSHEIATLREEHDRLDERVDSLSSGASDDREAVAGHAQSLAELRTAVEATGVRMDSVVSIVRQAVEGLLSHAEGREPSAEGRPSETSLAQLTRAVDTLAEDTRLHAEQQQDLRAAQAALRERFDELARQLAQDEPRPRLVPWAASTIPAETESAGALDADATEPIASLGGGR